MRKKAQKKAKTDVSNDVLNDCVVFMTAYHFDTVIKEFPHWKHKQDFCKLLTDCHITSISTGERPKNCVTAQSGANRAEI